MCSFTSMIGISCGTNQTPMPRVVRPSISRIRSGFSMLGSVMMTSWTAIRPTSGSTSPIRPSAGLPRNALPSAAPVPTVPTTQKGASLRMMRPISRSASASPPMISACRRNRRRSRRLNTRCTTAYRQTAMATITAANPATVSLR